MKKRIILTGVIAAAVSMCLSFSALAGGWVMDGNGWWFRNSDGSYPSSGIYDIGGKQYAFNESGYMVENGWFLHPRTGEWYYATDSGELASSTWIGDYYVGNDGSMMTDAWIDGYYVGSDGKWVQGRTQNDSYSYSGSSSDEYGDVHNPFLDAPLGYGYDNSSYSGSLGRSELETADTARHDWWLEY